MGLVRGGEIEPHVFEREAPLCLLSPWALGPVRGGVVEPIGLSGNLTLTLTTNPPKPSHPSHFTLTSP